MHLRGLDGNGNSGIEAHGHLLLHLVRIDTDDAQLDYPVLHEVHTGGLEVKNSQGALEVQLKLIIKKIHSTCLCCNVNLFGQKSIREDFPLMWIAQMEIKFEAHDFNNNIVHLKKGKQMLFGNTIPALGFPGTELIIIGSKQ
jgi:hypothetical protein